MTHALVAATLAVTALSLWIRRDTWHSSWEVGLTLSLALQGGAVLLMSPSAAGTAEPLLHEVLGRWNTQHLLGHLCLIAAAAAVVYHGLSRLVDAATLNALFNRNITKPLSLGVPLLVATFILADERYQADLLLAHVSSVWLGLYWLLLDAMLIYLLGYAIRILATLRRDPRSKPAATVYLVGCALQATACVVQVGTAWAGIDISLPVWICGCLGVMSFAFGAARSWRSRIGWFIPGPRPRQSIPPQPAS